MRWLLAGIALAAGCYDPAWGVLPGDGWTGVPSEATVRLEGGTRLDDAPALQDRIAWTRDHEPVPFEVVWDRDDPLAITLVPDAPLADDADYRLVLGDEPVRDGLYADPAVRGLPRRRIVRFTTASRPTLLGAAACGGEAPLVALTSEPVDEAPALRDGVDGPPEPIRWTRDPDTPRLWTADRLPDGLSDPQVHAAGARQPVRCDGRLADALVAAARGRFTQE